MTTNWLVDLWNWWGSLPRAMAFFFSLPFIVAAAGLLSGGCRGR